jgi:hypothetical protein
LPEHDRTAQATRRPHGRELLHRHLLLRWRSGGARAVSVPQTKRGKAVYRRRKAIVESVFGRVKHARGFRQFLQRGLKEVQGEWAPVCPGTTC